MHVEKYLVYWPSCCVFLTKFSEKAHNAGQNGAAQEGAQNQLVPRVDPRASEDSLIRTFEET